MRLRILSATMGVLSILALAVITYVEDSVAALVALTLSSLMWVFFAFLNGGGWRRALESWRHTLLDWDEQQRLTKDMANLLHEALSALSTWDREKADDIESRATTIILLRTKNFEERGDVP